MKSLSLFAFAGFALMAVPAAAAVTPIADLYNSGVNAAGTALAAGNVVDAHWTLAGGTAWNSSSINGAWLGSNATSRWLTPGSNGNASYDGSADGYYDYSLNFDLSGFSAGTAAFAGRFAADNAVTGIALNGTQIAQGGAGSFNAWTSFASTGGTFLSGLNTLTFTVKNVQQSSGNPTGLRVEFLESAISSVPEPASWAMLIAGFGMVGFASRRRRADFKRAIA